MHKICIKQASDKITLQQCQCINNESACACAYVRGLGRQRRAGASAPKEKEGGAQNIANYYITLAPYAQLQSDCTWYKHG